jgi:uncharacterized phage protein (TIGR01671 family)
MVYMEEPNSWGWFGDVIFQEPESYDVMQFTGLLDKNGKEIYEGDIVHYQARHYEKKMPVEFRDGGYCVVDGVRTYEVCDSAIHSCDKFEVIGNIYENAELINQ